MVSDLDDPSRVCQIGSLADVTDDASIAAMVDATEKVCGRSR